MSRRYTDFGFHSKELAFISTVIKASVPGTDWGNGVAPDIHEVQAMSIGNNLYIAANPGEAPYVKAFINSFGITSRRDFFKFLRYCHGLLTLPSSARKTVPEGAENTGRIGKNYMRKYSEQDRQVIDHFRGQIGSDVQSGLTHTEILEACRLITKSQKDKPLADQQRAWFLRNFVGAPTDQYNQRATGIPLAMLSQYKNHSFLNILQSKTNLHAEVVLLSFLANAAESAPASFKGKTVHIGGAKAACNRCDSWITYFTKWVAQTYEIEVRLPKNDVDGDHRPHGSGAGSRPDASGLEALNGRLVADAQARMLFDGADTGNFSTFAAAFA